MNYQKSGRNYFKIQRRLESQGSNCRSNINNYDRYFDGAAGAVILYMQNGKMFGIVVLLVILYLIIVITFNRWYEKLNRKQMEDNAQLTSYLVESLNGIQTIKAYNAEGKAKSETEIRFVRLLKSIFHLSWVSNL